MVKRKITALLLSAIMCLAFFPASAATVDVSYLDLKNITQEASFAITKDIDFSLVNSIADESGNEITWQSSDVAIEINGEKGIVKRGAEDKNVKLTATVNTTPETVKEFNLTVKAEDSYVSYSDNFSSVTEDEAGKDISQTSRKAYWERSGSSNTDEHEIAFTQDKVLCVNKKTATDVSSGIALKLDKKQNKVKTDLEFAIKAEADSNLYSSILLFCHVYGVDASGQSKKIAELRFSGADSNISLTDVWNDISYGNINSQVGEKISLSLDIDIKNNVYYLSTNGSEVGDGVIFQNNDTENPVVGLRNLNFTMYKTTYGERLEIYQAAAAYPKPALEFTTPIFKKVEEENETVIKTPSSGKIKAEISAINRTSELKNAALVAAVYTDGGKKLKNVCVDEKKIYSGESADLSATIELQNGETYRCFLLNSIKGITPLDIPAAAPFNVDTALSYDENGAAHTLVSWEESYAPQGNLAGYKIYRDQREIGSVEENVTQFKDYEGDLFSAREYEIRPVMKSGAEPKGTLALAPINETVKLKSTEVVDSVTGRTYNYIDFFGRDAIRDYYTTRNWANDSESHRFYFTDMDMKMFEYDTDTETVKYLDQRFQYDKNPPRDAMTIGRKTNSLYYVNENLEIMRMNLNTYEKEKVADCPAGTVRASFMSVSDDESRLVLTLSGNKKEAHIPVLNLETKEWDTSFNIPEDIKEEGMTFGMPIQNPVKNDYVLFCKVFGGAEEGSIAAPRLWLLDKKDNSYRPLYEERVAVMGDDNVPLHYGEVMNHENWTMDGEKVIIAKYSTDLTYQIATRGMSEISLDGTIRYLNDVRGGTHVSTSPASSEWIVYDGTGTASANTADKKTHITLMNTTTGQHYEIAEVVINRPHPGHAHPSFSYDGKKVWFTFETDDDDKKIRIGWADVADIVEAEVVGGRYPLGDNAEYTSYENTMNSVEKKTVDSKECFNIKKDNRMLINILDNKYFGARSVEGGKSYDVSIDITYLDSGSGKLILKMYYWNETLTDYYDKTRHFEKVIRLGNTNEWKTEKIELTNVSLDNINVLANDIKISATDCDIAVSDIKITVEENQ